MWIHIGIAGSALLVECGPSTRVSDEPAAPLAVIRLTPDDQAGQLGGRSSGASGALAAGASRGLTAIEQLSVGSAVEALPGGPALVATVPVALGALELTATGWSETLESGLDAVVDVSLAGTQPADSRAPREGQSSPEPDARIAKGIEPPEESAPPRPPKPPPPEDQPWRRYIASADNLSDDVDPDSRAVAAANTSSSSESRLLVTAERNGSNRELQPEILEQFGSPQKSELSGPDPSRTPQEKESEKPGEAESPSMAKTGGGQHGATDERSAQSEGREEGRASNQTSATDTQTVAAQDTTPSTGQESREASAGAPATSQPSLRAAGPGAPGFRRGPNPKRATRAQADDWWRPSVAFISAPPRAARSELQEAVVPIAAVQRVDPDRDRPEREDVPDPVSKASDADALGAESAEDPIAEAAAEGETPAPEPGTPSIDDGLDEDPIEALQREMGWRKPSTTRSKRMTPTASITGSSGSARSAPRVADHRLRFDDVHFTKTRDTPLGRYRQAIDEIILGLWNQSDLPLNERAIGIQGEVEVLFVVRRSGRVQDVQILRSSGHLELDRMAIEAIPERLPRFPKDLRQHEQVYQKVLFRYTNPIVTPSRPKR